MALFPICAKVIPTALSLFARLALYDARCTASGSIFGADSFNSLSPFDDSASRSASRSADRLIAFELVSVPALAFAAPRISSNFPENDGARATASSYFCFARPLLPSIN